MPKMNIERSIHIDANPETIFNKLNDFHTWSRWSPWLIMEEGVKVNVQPDGKYYDWEGKRIGSGNMKVLNEKENEAIAMDLNFLKPWKSHAHIGFKLIPKGKGTDVSWTMDSSLPFFMFWMKKMMIAYVGMDFERGLKMLKDYVEDGKVHSNLKIDGTTQFDGCKYIGIKGSCAVDQIGKDMGTKIETLSSYIEENKIIPTGDGLAIYHKWDLIGRKADYTVGIPVKEHPANMSNNIVAGEIPKTKTNKVTHKGAYEHLGNAWSLQQMMMRGKEFKGDKKVDPFELYKNNPSNTDKSDLLTEIYFGIK